MFRIQLISGPMTISNLKRKSPLFVEMNLTKVPKKTYHIRIRFIALNTRKKVSEFLQSQSGFLVFFEKARAANDDIPEIDEAGHIYVPVLQRKEG